MTISRRNFLREGTVAGLATIATVTLAGTGYGQSMGVKKPSSGTTPIPHETTPLDNLTREMFASVVGSTFVVTHPIHGRVDMYLKDVEDLTPELFKSKAKFGIECFNLVFACQSSLELGQGTVVMDHDKLGNFELFIVPGKLMRYGMDYGALINRLFP